MLKLLTWSPSCASLVAIRPFACKKKRFAQKFTDGWTDGWTDDGRRAIAHSWNELKTELTNNSVHNERKQTVKETIKLYGRRPIFWHKTQFVHQQRR